MKDEKTMTPELKEKKEPNPTRMERRLRDRQADKLNVIVNLYMSEKTYAKTPEEEDEIYRRHRNQWFIECDKFNKSPNRRYFTLRYEAFQDRINYIIKVRETNEAEAAAKKLKNKYDLWRSSTELWKAHFFRSLWFWIISKGNREKMEQLWSVYFASKIYKK